MLGQSRRHVVNLRQPRADEVRCEIRDRRDDDASPSADGCPKSASAGCRKGHSAAQDANASRHCCRSRGCQRHLRGGRRRGRAEGRRRSGGGIQRGGQSSDRRGQGLVRIDHGDLRLGQSRYPVDDSEEPSRQLSCDQRLDHHHDRVDVRRDQRENIDNLASRRSEAKEELASVRGLEPLVKAAQTFREGLDEAALRELQLRIIDVVLELADLGRSGLQGSRKLRPEPLVKLIGKLEQRVAVRKHFALFEHLREFFGSNTQSIREDIHGSRQTLA